MPEPQQLRRTPITEALVDLRAAPTRFSPECRARFADAVRDLYPNSRDQRSFEAQLRIETGKGPVASAAEVGLAGFQFLTEDKLTIVQFRANGFTFNRLSPYKGGDSLLSEALRLWGVYVDVAAPVGVSRVALRFINNLTLPREVARFGEFLDSPPAPPPGAGPVLQGFSLRVRSHDLHSGLTVTRTLASARTRPGADGLGVLIDIDAFCTADLAVDAGALRPVLDSLRELKNRVFFGSITQRTVDLLNDPDPAIRIG
jgi:uncharacterized protein (TIGR04255 family)